MLPHELFLDTSYTVALFNPKDRFHDRATRIAEQLKARDSQVVTTRAVTIEIGNAFSKERHRAAGIQILQTLELDPGVEIVSLSEPLYNEAFELFQARLDKEWGITDCVSFVVMAERKITAALTADVHFHQSGFRALLRENI